ncbi:MAG: aminoglycoside phosphotransferase family protein [Algoriphagus sp.]|nr:aminoglycoside phosphotransferase family protein [Algoriphagus sp.]
MNHSSLLEVIASNYSLNSSKALQIKPLGEGLIHQTFLIEGHPKSWVLQGFNTNVFKYPERIASNLKLLSKLSDIEPLPFILPLPLENKNGETLTEVEGQFYRLFEFVKGNTIQKITDPNQAYLAAKAYGEFADWGKEIKAEDLQESIPNFHRLDLRFSRFLEVLKSKKSLALEEKEVADFYAGQSALIERYISLVQSLPFRLTHNDTKINNLIFSENLERVEAVIDLDTLMAGMLLYDFGDLVRTVACSEPETSQNWLNLILIPEVFEVLLKGYWEGIKDFATTEEIKSLLLGGEVMTIIMGLRFFTDHLEGNVYYRVEYPEQNFHRAKNQMIFLQSQQSLRPVLQQIWEEVTGSKL